ncbi:hypothetical protein [Oceanispirochaeta sp. M1]|uniref:hypothetical protein n=1 Tax=Oceanispirochaeta sp. M1 TaxID=2283433 RepID=UPI000E09464C|nr:hypothetical protein [Oceanispirochaeta sp. M1]NPD75318.1 hypothetical protein [Oceanispirochaeta sp. M1]RDG28841.1 hypothetical protein DV872_24795 [Oceanispirochaeta sp. M1]
MPENKKTTKEKQAELYQWYIKVRDDYKASYRSQTNQYDKYLITLASGSFGISFAFVDSFLPKVIKNPVLLPLAWAAFALCILLSLIAFLVGVKAFETQIKLHDVEYQRMKDRIDGKSEVVTSTEARRKGKSNNIFSEVVKELSIITMSLYATGNILLIVFVFINFK